MGLAHRRLSIVDLESGSQPIGNEDESIQVVFNGEIYNFRVLRRELESRGHHFRTVSDTEVIVHLYEEVGEDCVRRLRGMFAFAIWDSRKRRLFLARDRVGIKPLFVSLNADRIVFGSELKALLAHGDIPREVDAAAIDEYLTYGMIPGRRSVCRGVEKLQPGFTLTVDVDRWKVTQQRYWQLRCESDDTLTAEQWQESVLEKLKESVRLHLMGDVRVGAFLSGGIDSSLVTALACEELRVPLQTFSMGFREAAFNELPAARETACHLGTDHFEEVVSPNAVDLLPELTRFYDEPFADSSAVPSYLVSKLASRHVKVVLSGDGGDEALGGYSRYAHDLRECAIRDLLPTWLRGPWLATLAKSWPKADWLPRPLRLKTFLTNLSQEPAGAYANTLSLCRQPLRNRLLNADLREFAASNAPTNVVIDGYSAARCPDPLSGMISADMVTLLPDDYLVKVDRASMAHGLEVRPPMLDHEFLELCARVPSRWKIHNGQTKWLLKETARSLLPGPILNRPKQGFEIPVDGWFRGPLQEMFRETVLAKNALLSGLIDQPTAAAVFESHSRGGGRHGGTLWSLLSLGCWATNSCASSPRNRKFHSHLSTSRLECRPVSESDPRPTICQVLLTLDIGGAELLAAGIARALCDRYRFVFACLDVRGVIGTELEADGFPVEVIDRTQGIDVKCALRLSALLRRRKVDVIHAHQYTPFFQSQVARLAAQNVPVIFTEHGRHHPDTCGTKRVGFNRLMLREDDRVIGVGESVRKALIVNEGFGAERVEVIRNGVDIERFSAVRDDIAMRQAVRKELGLKRNEYAVLQVARLNQLKDHATAVRAVGRLRRRGVPVRLLLAGDGEEQSRIRSVVCEAECEDDVTFLGERDDVHRLLSAADTFLLSSISEGIPLTLIEAMAAGVPVVSTRVGGVAEVLIDGESGLLAEAQNDA